MQAGADSRRPGSSLRAFRRRWRLRGILSYRAPFRQRRHNTEPAATVAGESARVAELQCSGCSEAVSPGCTFLAFRRSPPWSVRVYTRAPWRRIRPSRSSSRITGPIRRRCITHCRAPGSQGRTSPAHQLVVLTWASDSYPANSRRRTATGPMLAGTTPTAALALLLPRHAAEVVVPWSPSLAWLYVLAAAACSASWRASRTSARPAPAPLRVGSPARSMC